MSNNNNLEESVRNIRKGNKKLRNLIAILVVMAVAAAFILVVHAVSSGDNDSESTGDIATESSGSEMVEDTGVAGDIALDEAEMVGSDQLSISSLYTSTIFNPDADMAYGEDVASIEVTNTSNQYLVNAVLAADLSDGSQAVFRIYDLPAGQTVEAFDVNNASLGANVTCSGVTCNSEEYMDSDPLFDGLRIEMSGLSAVITNSTESAFDHLTVTYHCQDGDFYFGGAAYQVMIESLSAGESYILEDDSFQLGTPVIVRIETTE